MKALQQVRIFFPREVPKNMDLREYLKGYAAEMEHANVTGGDPVTTARIALVHIDENPRYYSLLEKYVEKKGLSGLGKLSADDMAEFRKQMDWEPGGIQEKIFMDRYDVASLKYNKEKFLWVLKHGGVPDRYKDRAFSFGQFQMKINDVHDPDSLGDGLTRSMSWEEWQQAKESGYFSSSGDLNVLAPKKVTF